jgi:hypothetical protein
VHWPGTPLNNNYRGPTVAPHNAYRTSHGEYTDWCVIVCHTDGVLADKAVPFSVYGGDAPMSDAQPLPGPLTGLRILELADEKRQFCGKLLGDLGADVVKIEPPGGEPCRHIGPFLDDIPAPERSLSFWYYNTSKRGITLNLHTVDGRRLFGR